MYRFVVSTSEPRALAIAVGSPVASNERILNEGNNGSQKSCCRARFHETKIFDLREETYSADGNQVETTKWKIRFVEAKKQRTKQSSKPQALNVVCTGIERTDQYMDTAIPMATTNAHTYESPRKRACSSQDLKYERRAHKRHQQHSREASKKTLCGWRRLVLTVSVEK